MVSKTKPESVDIPSVAPKSKLSTIALATIGTIDLSSRTDRRGGIIEVALAAEMSVVTRCSCKKEGHPSTVGICTCEGARAENILTSLFFDLRTSEYLFAAWRHVKGRAQSSKNGAIRASATCFQNASKNKFGAAKGAVSH